MNLRHPSSGLIAGIVLFVAAVAVRIVCLGQIRGTMISNYLTDSAIYDRWARDILSGTETSSEAFYMGPLYPYSISLIYRLFGVNYLPVLVFQAVLTSLSCLLVFAIGRRVFGLMAGVIAGSLFLLYPVLLFYDGCILGESLLVFLYLAIAYSLIRATERDGLGWWAAAGALTGLAALGRASILLYVLLLVPAYLVINWKGFSTRSTGPIYSPERRSRLVRSLVCFVVCLFAVILPVTVRNYSVSGDLVLITSNFGLNFYIGNNPDAQGDYKTPGEIYLMSDLTGKSTAEKETGRTLKPSQVSRYWFARGLDFIRSEPGAYVSLLARKLRLFWNDYEIPQAENLYFSRQYSPLLRIPILGFGFIASLGLVGIVISLRKWRRLYVIHLLMLSFMVSSILFFVVSRYRIHIVPFLILFSAYTIRYVIKTFSSRRRRAAQTILRLAPIGLAGALLIFSHLPVEGFTVERAMSEGYNLNGFYQAFFHGHFEDAIRSFNRALEYVPGDIETYNNIGTTYFRMGEYDKAVEVFRRLIEMEPQRFTFYLNLGLAYARTGRYEDSVEVLKEAVRLEPNSIDAARALTQVESRIQKDQEREEERR